MATSEGIPSSIDIEFLELNDNPYLNKCQGERVALIGASPLLFRNTKNTETKFVEHNMLLQVCIVYDVLH